MSKRQIMSDFCKAGDNIRKCWSTMVPEFVLNDSIPEAIIEELLDETIKYLSFIQRRLDEISVGTTVDKPEQPL